MRADEPEMLRRLLVWLATRGAADRASKPADTNAFAEYLIRQQLTAIRDGREASKLFGDHPDHFESTEVRRFLWLQPIRTGRKALPVVAVGYDFRRSHPEVRLRVGMFLHDDDTVEQCLGYRFETPEGDGIHHYYHVQHITGFTKDHGVWRLPTPPWMPVKQPAVPLDADGPVSLLVSVILALYGRGMLKELQSDGRLWSAVLPSVRGLMKRLDDLEPRYFRVVDAAGANRVCKTWFQEGDFRQFAAKQFPKARAVENSSVADWLKVDATEQLVV